MRSVLSRLLPLLLSVALLAAGSVYGQQDEQRQRPGSAAWYGEVLGHAERTYSVQFNPRRKFIVVTQTLSNATEYIRSLQKLGVVAAIIPKSSKALHPEIIQQWKAAGWPVRDDIDRAKLASPEEALAFLRGTVADSDEFVIVDHSGYFAPAASAISAAPDLAPKCRGIVDSTKSGTLAYAKAGEPPGIPLLNVYDTSVKSDEGRYIASDFLAGSDKVLVGAKVEKDHIRTIGVIGMGKTGKPIADGLRRQFGPNVRIIVYDKEDSPAVRSALITQSDLIISATGENPLLDSDFSRMKRGAFLAPITGADEELDLPRRLRAGVLTEAPLHQQLSMLTVPGTAVRYVTTYRAGENSIHLLLGQPLNYVLDQQDPRISYLHGLKLFAIARLLDGQNADPSAVEHDYLRVLAIGGIGPCAERALVKDLEQTPR